MDAYDIIQKLVPQSTVILSNRTMIPAQNA